MIAQSFHHWGGWDGWGWGVGWHQHTVVVNNSFYIRNNYRLPSNYIRSGPSAWSHDPSHRGGVAYPSRGVAGRVGAAEADPRKGKISNESPLGRALLSHQAGDDVTVEAPGGTFKVKVVKIK